MESPQHRKIHTINLFFSSWVLIFLTVGIVVDEWVQLKTEKLPISHSPWKGCLGLLKEDNIDQIRIMMGTILSLAFFYNFFLGLGFTHMIPHKEYTCFTTIVLSFFTGVFLLITLLVYYYSIKQGQNKYYQSYQLTWITCFNYLNVFILTISGILSLLLFTSKTLFLNSVHASGHSLPGADANSPSTSSSQQTETKPRSIVHKHSDDQSENKPHVQTRRVTWAL